MTCVPTQIPSEDIQWITGRLQDPTGRTFVLEEQIYRTVRPEAMPRVTRLFEQGIVRELVEKKLLIPTEAAADISVAGASMVLKHQRVPFNTSAAEWCRPLLRDAALAWIDLNLALYPHGLATADAHWGNFGQLGCCRPVWLDFGSIVELTDPRQGLDEFHRSFRNSLRLLTRSAGLARLMRGINHLGGFSDYEAASLGFASFPGGRRLQNALDRGRTAWHRGRKRFGWKSASARMSDRVMFLQKERDEIAAIDLPKIKTAWGEYHADNLLTGEAPKVEGDSRRARILQTIAKLRPKTAIDLAGNAGFYSVFAARQGARVLCADFDETACERFYQAARKFDQPWELTSACCDVMRVPFQRQHLPREAELVLALALTHHLALGQGYSFPTIVSTLARYTTGALIVDYMPNGLGGDVPRPDPLPDWYTREQFEHELRRRFQHVEVVAEHRLPRWRVLYLAQGRR